MRSRWRTGRKHPERAGKAALGDRDGFVPGLPAGKTVQAVKAVDADGTALQVVEVARDKTYSFVMPAKAVTLSVELTDVSDVAKAIVSRDTVTRIEAEDYDEQGRPWASMLNLQRNPGAARTWAAPMQATTCSTTTSMWKQAPTNSRLAWRATTRTAAWKDPRTA